MVMDLKEGQQIKFSGISAQNNSTAITTSDVFTVRNPGTNTFELFEAVMVLLQILHHLLHQEMFYMVLLYVQM